MSDTTDNGTDPVKAGEVIEAAFGPGGIGDDDPDAATKAKAKAKKPPVIAQEALGYYADLPELALGLKLTKVGDGLSTAMTVTGRRHVKGEKVLIVTEAEVRKFEHEGLKDVDGWRVVEVYDGIRSTIIDLDEQGAGALLKRLDKQDTANTKAEEAAAGVQSFDGMDDA